MFYEGNHVKIINEEHIHLVKEPKFEYFELISVKNGNANLFVTILFYFWILNRLVLKIFYRSVVMKPQ